MVTRQASSLKRKNSTSVGLLSDLNKHRQVGNPHYWFLLIKIFWNLAFSFKQIQFGTTDFNINGTSLSCFCTNTAVLPQNATAKSPICKFKGEKTDCGRSFHIQTVGRHKRRIKVKFPVFIQNEVNI